MSEIKIHSLTPGLPEYRLARHFLQTLDGVTYSLYREMYNSIWGQSGSPQSTVDWTDPEQWIPERLMGDQADLALKLWRQSGRELNPRYTRGCWYLCMNHQLLKRDPQNILRITEKGEQFRAHSDGEIAAEIDGYEGILTILRLVADRGPGKRSEFLSDFTDFCHTFTNYRSDNPIKGALYDRLVNLIDREHVSRSGQIYRVTEKGLAHLEKFVGLLPGSVAPEPGKQAHLRRLANEIGIEARNQLAAHLASMDAYKFEGLIKLLLVEMGYSDVQITPSTNDKGVDVVANIELGISSVREVVQVKRHKGSLNRPVLDQLRGSLHRFDAVRGTIITTGSYSRVPRRQHLKGVPHPLL
jgi:restriction system protein